MAKSLSDAIFCSLCSEKPSCGAKIKCRERGCNTHFHPMCAISARLLIVPPDENLNCFGVYCAEHAHSTPASEVCEASFDQKAARMGVNEIFKATGQPDAVIYCIYSDSLTKQRLERSHHAESFTS